MTPETRTTTQIIPCLFYDDAEAAIDWLTRVLGFTARRVVRGGADKPVRHAELCLRDAMVMVGSTWDEGFGKLQKTPRVAGTVTCSPYIVVDDVEAHHAGVVEAGGEIALPLTREHYGANYACRDPEGHLWSFGDYDPFAVRWAGSAAD